ncbi:MAG: hypothetical protein FWH36_04810 [Lentimicrobiaceae bacterium]|nr:hypothetical protein [Lentimicrobiaceae bacterium]
MKYKKVLFFPMFFGIVVLLSGCFNKTKPVEIKVFFANQIWNYFNPMNAKFEISDTKKTYEIAVSLSVIDGFELEEVPFEMMITSPDGQENIVNSTMIVKKDGKYLGKVYGDV